jgi:hypothetical protein
MKNGTRNASRFFYALSALAIATFLWRFLVPAHEEADTNLMIGMEVFLEFASLAALVVLFVQLMSRSSESARLAIVVVFCAALIASLGILLMRFSTTDGWYTGHRVYQPGYGLLEPLKDGGAHSFRVALR